MTSCHLRWPEVIRNWRHLTGSHLEVAVEGRTLTYTVRFTSYKDVARRSRHSRDRKWRHVTLNDRKWPRSDVTWPESPGSGCRRRKLTCTVCFTSYKAVARWRRQARDRKRCHVLRWPEVTRKWRHLTASHLEVAVESRKLAYASCFTSYKAVAHRRRQSRDRKWGHVTSGDRKWAGSDVLSPQVT